MKGGDKAKRRAKKDLVKTSKKALRAKTAGGNGGTYGGGGGGGVGGKPEPEIDRLSNILKVFNEQFGNIEWEDGDRVRRMITEEIPAKVAADKAYQNAMRNSDKDNAKIEHAKALERVMTAVLNDDTQVSNHQLSWWYGGEPLKAV
jgi:hypothetical protein